MDVSIIIPIYNVAPYIRDCLHSVMRQTYTGSMECLLIDDCGTDDSIVIAERMIAEYNDNLLQTRKLEETTKGRTITRGVRFKIVHHEFNRGLSAARNTGTVNATGEYLYYLDSDDEITDECIEKMMMMVLKDPAIEMVQGKYDINGDGISYPVVKKDQILPITTNMDARQCYYHRHQIVVYAWNKLIKRSFLIRHHLSFKEGILYEDNLWIFYLMKYVNNVHFISDITYRHRKRPGSITTGLAKKTKAYHHSIVYQDIITHLSSGSEVEECHFYVRRFWSCFCRYAKIEPAYQDVFPLYWRKVRQLKLYSSCLYLASGYVLGKFKYGWVVCSLLARLKHPRLIIRNIYRYRCLRTRYVGSKRCS